MDRELLVCSIDPLCHDELYVGRLVSVRRLLSRSTRTVLHVRMNEGRRVLGIPSGMVLPTHPLLGICMPPATRQLDRQIRRDDLQRDGWANLLLGE